MIKINVNFVILIILLKMVNVIYNHKVFNIVINILILKCVFNVNRIIIYMIINVMN